MWFSIVVVAAVNVLCAGCPPERGSDPPSTLYFAPASALQGSWPSITLTTEESVFARCAKIQPDYLKFAQSDKEELSNKISVKELVKSAGNVLEASIAIADDAPAGPYDAFFSCDDSIVLRGQLVVRERRAEPSITLVPSDIAAGAMREKLKIIGRHVAFVDGKSHVAFGRPDKVTVLEEKVLSSSQMEISVSVSESTPAETMEVAVITGQEVARGKIGVVSLVVPTIQVSPTWIERPAQDGEGPSRVTLTIEGKNILFSPLEQGVPNDSDAAPDTDDEPVGTLVEFPENTGLAVTGIDYLGPDEIEVEVELDSKTPVGVTPLIVTSADAVAKTSFAVRRPQGAPGLEFYPAHVVRGVGESLIWIRAVGFDLAPLLDDSLSEEQTGVAFANPECLFQNRCVMHAAPEVNPPFESPGSEGAPDEKTVTMWLRPSVTADYPEDFAVLEVRTPQGTVSERIDVVDPDGTQLVADIFRLLQGNPAWMGLSLAGGEFSSASAKPFYSRSGVELVTEIALKQHMVRVKVASDAPTGPLETRIETGGRVRSTAVKVLPNGTDASIRVIPEQVFEEQRTVVARVELDGMRYDEQLTRFAFDDPEIRVLDTAKLDERTALVRFSIGPGALDEPVVLYADSVDLNGQDQRAAASIRCIKKPRMLPKVTPQSVARKEGNSHTLEISNLVGFAWSENTVARAMEGIGLEITSVHVDSADPTRLFVEVELEEEGPGGWTGLVLVSEKETMAVALRIVSGDDESLTMGVTPPSVEPGVTGESVVFGLPAQASLPWSLEAAWSGDVSAHVGRPQNLNPAEDGGPRSRALLDVSRKINAPIEVPIYVLTNSGAAVGFVSVEERRVGELVESIPEEVTAQPGEKVSLIFRPETWPVSLETTNGDDEYAPVDIDLVSPSQFGAYFAGRAERLWFMSADQRQIDVMVGESTAAENPVIRLRSWNPLPLLETGNPQSLSSSCELPYLARGRIDNSFDEVELSLGDVACPFAAVIVARQLVDRAWETPDTWLGLYVGADGLGPSIARSSGWPVGGVDPTVFGSKRSEGGARLVVGAERGTTGSFLINLRGHNIIREISRDPAFSFIELEVNPRGDLGELSLELVDAQTGLILGTYSLAGKEIETDDGVVVIGAPGTLGRNGVDAVSAVSLFPDGSPFAVLLKSGKDVVDAVQVGGDGSFGEGSPIPLDGAVNQQRQGRMDTDDNSFDFVGWSKGTPGR